MVVTVNPATNKIAGPFRKKVILKVRFSPNEAWRTPFNDQEVRG